MMRKSPIQFLHTARSPLFRVTLLATFLAFTVALSACSSYRMEVQQGNVIEAAALKQLRAGLSRAQVVELLGSPLLQDDFQKNRWDYIFYLRKAGKTPERKSVTVIFHDNGTVAQVIQ
ncbi:MAG: outer membrane protein assembly factor BamE [bacterium]